MLLWILHSHIKNIQAKGQVKCVRSLSQYGNFPCSWCLSYTARKASFWLWARTSVRPVGMRILESPHWKLGWAAHCHQSPIPWRPYGKTRVQRIWVFHLQIIDTRSAPTPALSVFSKLWSFWMWVSIDFMQIISRDHHLRELLTWQQMEELCELHVRSTLWIFHRDLWKEWTHLPHTVTTAF